MKAPPIEQLSNELKRPGNILIHNHNVLRYHSFDLIRYQIYLDTLDDNDGKAHFMSLDPAYRMLLEPLKPETIHFMQAHVKEANIYDCFGISMGIQTMDQYEDRLANMFGSKLAKYTPTDLFDRFDLVFKRDGFTGVVVQYENDDSLPEWTSLSSVQVIRKRHLHDFDWLARLIISKEINCIFMAGLEPAIHLMVELHKNNIRWRTTFLIGRYAYNFIHDEAGRPIMPRYTSDFLAMEKQYGDELGFFDPFTGLTEYLHKTREDNDVSNKTAPNGS